MTRHLNRRGFLALSVAGLTQPRALWADGMVKADGRAFGTSWRLVSPSLPVDLAAKIQRLFETFDAEISPWRSDSAVSRFNAGLASIAAGSEFDIIARAAVDLACASDGAFDPTCGPLVANWGFGPIHGASAPDWRGLEIVDHAVRARPGLTFDPCGIAKGRALDLAAQLAAKAGCRSALFDLGGEVVAIGKHPSGRTWTVGIENPMGGAPLAHLSLEPGSAVATSGVAAQSYGLGNRVWGHIIDPRIGAPAQGSLRSVTVVERSAMMADGWATALFAAGDVGGPQMARDHRLRSVFVFDDNGEPRTIATGNMKMVRT